MKPKLLFILVVTLLTASFSFAQHVRYPGSRHTYSHGGHYAGGQGSSHRGGHYRNARTHNEYGRHKR